MPDSTKRTKGHKYNRSLDLGKYDFNRKNRCQDTKFVSADKVNRGVIDGNDVVIASANNIEILKQEIDNQTKYTMSPPQTTTSYFGATSGPRPNALGLPPEDSKQYLSMMKGKSNYLWNMIEPSFQRAMSVTQRYKLLK